MEYSERKATLENTDLSKPIGVMKFQNIFSLAMMVLLPIFFFVIFIEFSIIYPVLLSAFSIGLFLFVRKYTEKYNKKVREDLRNGQKIIIQGIIKEKYRTGFGRSTMLYIKIGARNLKVDHKTYYNFEAHQKVEVHLAPVSEFVIKILHLDKS